MPYAPTVQDRTGEFLMRGITGAADSLAQGIREWNKNKEESAGFDTLIEGAVRADPTLAEKYGDQLAKAPSMSLSQKKSLAGTLALETQNKRLAQEQQMKEQDFNLRKAYFNLQQGAMNRATERDLAGQRFTETLASLAAAGGAPSMDFANTMAGEPMPARELGLADIVQAAGQSGLAMEPASLAQLIRAEQMGQRQGLAVDPTPIPFSAGGLSGVFSPKTGQFQVDKPEPNPKDARMTVVLERDEMDRPTRTWTGSPKQYEEQFGKPMSGAGGQGKPLTREVAAELLKQAGGDKAKARELARQAGYTF